MLCFTSAFAWHLSTEAGRRAEGIRAHRLPLCDPIDCGQILGSFPCGNVMPFVLPVSVQGSGSVKCRVLQTEHDGDCPLALKTT